MAREGAVYIHPRHPFIPGVSVRVESSQSWSTRYDIRSGWVRVAPDGTADSEIAEIAKGVLIGERNGELNSVWLNPLFW